RADLPLDLFDAARLCDLRRLWRGRLPRLSRQQGVRGFSALSLRAVADRRCDHRRRDRPSQAAGRMVPCHDGGTSGLPAQHSSAPRGGAGKNGADMTTIRLTMAQALVRFLAAQKTEIDGKREPIFAGMWAIFGHGNVAGMGEALFGARDALP